ncbi:hypothetical protein ACVWWG_001663 [Bradyrhizobium sp. LB7.2]
MTRNQTGRGPPRFNEGAPLRSVPRSLLSLARKCHGSGLSARPPYEKKSPKTCATVPARLGTLFAGGKTRRSRPKSRSRSRRSLRNSQKPQRPHCGDVGLSKERVVYAKLANLRSLPATLRRAEAPETYASVAGQHKCHWSKRSQATPLLPNASTPTTLPRRSRQRKAQSGGSGRAISPRTGPDPRRPCPFYSP